MITAYPHHPVGNPIPSTRNEADETCTCLLVDWMEERTVGQFENELISSFGDDCMITISFWPGTRFVRGM